MSRSSTPPGFATVREVARFVGVSEQAIRQGYVDDLGDDDVQRGRPLFLRVAAVVELVIQRRVADRVRPIPTSGDPLLEVGDSPALERYRLAKAMTAELDLAERKGELIDVAKCNAVLHRWGSILRRAGDRLNRISAESGSVLGEAIDECESVIRELER